MKKYLGFLVVIGLLVSSCGKKDNSPEVTQIFDLETLTGVELSISGNVKIVEGATQNIKVTGPKETVNKILKTVNSGIWNISLSSGYNDSYDKLEITITSNEIQTLNVNSSGNIKGKNILTLSSIGISGSGSIDVRTESTTLISDISGSGNITISGSADLVKHSTSGSGKFYGFKLETSNMKIDNSGSGKSEIFVITSLDVDISGSGNVYYKGTPTITQDISGSGKLIDEN